MTDTAQNNSRIVLVRRMAAVAMMAMMISHAEAATLRPEVAIAGSAVTVGDLFDGVTAHADYALAPAPVPGKPLVLRAADLTRVATTFGIDWRAETGLEQVVLKSVREPLERSVLKNTLDAAAAGMGVDLQLPDAVNLTAAGTPTVESFSVDDQRQTFTARLALPQVDGSTSVEVVQGRAFAMVQVPVLKTALRNTDMIGPGDIEYISRRRDVVPTDALLDGNRIVGMMPRRSLRHGQPIQANDLESPMMVKKGQQVTLTLKNGPITLSLLGRAMQNGTAGDVIRVLNTASNQMVEGTVDGFQVVSVAPPAGLVVN